MSVIAVSFIVVFALILFAVSVGLKFFDARRKTQMVGMLETATGEKTVTLTNLLKEIEPDKPTGLSQVVSSLHFSKHAQEQITQAGLTWSSNRLLVMMAGMAVLGLFLGVSMPGPLSGPTAAVILAAGIGSLPYVYVRRTRKKRLDTLEEQFPEALDFLARSMRAGHAFTISLEMIGEEVRDPLGQEFRALFNEQNLGAPPEVAMANLPMRVPLPVVTMLGLLFVAPGYLQGMADDPDGKKMIGGAIVAQILGNICIKKIINI